MEAFLILSNSLRMCTSLHPLWGSLSPFLLLYAPPDVWWVLVPPPLNNIVIFESVLNMVDMWTMMTMSPKSRAKILYQK